MKLPVARVTDIHDCPQHGKNAILKGGTMMADDLPIARLGDECACGGKIIEGSMQLLDDGLPVAYLGCKTSCGGLITSGSLTCEVEP